MWHPTPLPMPACRLSGGACPPHGFTRAPSAISATLDSRCQCHFGWHPSATLPCLVNLTPFGLPCTILVPLSVLPGPQCYLYFCLVNSVSLRFSFLTLAYMCLPCNQEHRLFFF